MRHVGLGNVGSTRLEKPDYAPVAIQIHDVIRTADQGNNQDSLYPGQQVLGAYRVSRDADIFSFCHVEDLVDGFLRLMETDEDVTDPVNLGNSGEFTIRQLAEMVVAMTG